MSGFERMERHYSKDWCQGVCTQCGTSCADHCEDILEQREEKEKLETTLQKMLETETKLSPDDCQIVVRWLESPTMAPVLHSMVTCLYAENQRFRKEAWLRK